MTRLSYESLVAGVDGLGDRRPPHLRCVRSAHDAACRRCRSLGDTGPQEDDAAQKYWSDRERGWFWYQLPPSEQEQKPKTTPPAAVTPRAEPARSPALLEFDALQKRVEELRNIAIIRPTERNIRNYLAVQAEVIDKASVFADVAQRVIWANPEFDYTVTGRPVNAKALEVFDRDRSTRARARPSRWPRIMRCSSFSAPIVRTATNSART